MCLVRIVVRSESKKKSLGLSKTVHRFSTVACASNIARIDLFGVPLSRFLKAGESEKFFFFCPRFFAQDDGITYSYRDDNYVDCYDKITEEIKHFLCDENLNTSENKVLYVTHGRPLSSSGYFVERIKQILELFGSEVTS